MVAQRGSPPSPTNHLSSISSKSSSRLSNHSSRMSLYNHCGYHLPESGFDRIKCHCPNVYNHLSANNYYKSSLTSSSSSSSFSSPKAIWMINEQKQPSSSSSSPPRTRTRKMPKYQIVSNLMKNIVKSKTLFSWQQQASVVKLVGSFLIGILFLSLVAMAVLIRVENKVPPRPTPFPTTTTTRIATAAKLTTSALNDPNNILLASSTTETSSIKSIANNENENNHKVENMSLFLGKQPQMPELNEEIYSIADHTNESLSSSKLDSSIQGSLMTNDPLKKQSSFAKSSSFIPIKLIIDDMHVLPSIQNHGQGTSKLPSSPSVTTSSTIFASTKSKSKRIIIEMDIKVNQSSN